MLMKKLCILSKNDLVNGVRFSEDSSKVFDLIFVGCLICIAVSIMVSGASAWLYEVYK